MLCGLYSITLFIMFLAKLISKSSVLLMANYPVLAEVLAIDRFDCRWLGPADKTN
jgi:hypothetical protein